MEGALLPSNLLCNSRTSANERPNVKLHYVHLLALDKYCSAQLSGTNLERRAATSTEAL